MSDNSDVTAWLRYIRQARLLGHSDSDITLERYSHWYKGESNCDAVEGLATALRAPRDGKRMVSGGDRSASLGNFTGIFGLNAELVQRLTEAAPCWSGLPPTERRGFLLRIAGSCWSDSGVMVTEMATSLIRLRGARYRRGFSVEQVADSAACRTMAWSSPAPGAVLSEPT